MSQKLKEVDQELQRAYMNIFLARYVLKAYKTVDQKLQREYMNIFLIRYVLKHKVID